MDKYEKNLADLQHSFNLTIAITFISVAIGGSLTILTGLKQLFSHLDNTTPILVSIVWICIFGFFGVRTLYQCRDIQEKISKCIVK